MEDDYYMGNFEDLEIEEDNEELIYDDQNFEEEASDNLQVANPLKKRINIDDDETIPDIRKSKESPRNSGRQSRNFSDQSRQRPSDKIAKRGSNSKSMKLL